MLLAVNYVTFGLVPYLTVWCLISIVDMASLK